MTEPTRKELWTEANRLLRANPVPKPKTKKREPPKGKGLCRICGGALKKVKVGQAQASVHEKCKVTIVGGGLPSLGRRK